MRANLAVLPLRAVLYLRQSTAREESISLELQETAGREHCARQGYVVVAVEADPGISGRTWKRPAVQRVMTMIEEREADVIVLWKWSRLSRSRLDWAVAADRVESARGRIESATEPLDVSTSAGRLARGVMTEFAAFESERIGDVWKETHARRLQRGLPANGKPRFGYSYTREAGFTPDPITGPVLAEMYARYISGTSVYALTKWLNDGPTRPAGGYGQPAGAWTDRTIRRVMDSGFGAGLLHSNGLHVQGAHVGVISADQWEAYVEARTRRRTYRRAERSEHLLSGMLRCACGSPMHGGTKGIDGRPKYRCKDAHDRRAHEGGYVTASVVEGAVLDFLRALREQMEQSAQAKLREQPPRLRNVVTEVDHLDRELGQVLGRLDDLTMRLLEGTVSQSAYLRAREQLESKQHRLQAARATAVVRSTSNPVVVLQGVLEQWDALNVSARREVLRLLIDHVEVTPGRPRSQIVIVPR